ENPKGTWTEISKFLEQSGAQPVGISPESELNATPSDAEIAWMRTIAASGPRVVTDVVRCWNRLPALCPNPEAALFILLVRDPTTWVTDHLLPSSKRTWRKGAMDNWRKHSYIYRKRFFDNYHYETIIAQALRQDHRLWRAVKMPIAHLRRAPAFIKLLAFW